MTPQEIKHLQITRGLGVLLMLVAAVVGVALLFILGVGRDDWSGGLIACGLLFISGPAVFRTLVFLVRGDIKYVTTFYDEKRGW